MRISRRTITWKRLAGIALLLVVVILWVISTRYYIGLNNGKGTTVDLWAGGIYVELGSRDPSSKPGTLFYSVHSQGVFRYWFMFKSSPPLSRYFVPLWAPTLLLALVNIWLWRTVLFASASRRAGLCTNCSYDRRGIDPTSRCPECGALP